MNRRTFNAMGLAAIFVQLPQRGLAQQAARHVTGFQFASINAGLLTASHEGMARHDVMVDNETLFQVASCSKTATALAIMTLVRDGRIDIGMPVNRYLTRWQLPGPRGATATISELMSHTAGTTIHGFGGYGPTDVLPDMLEILAGRRPANSGAIRARHRLFSQFRYSGGGTIVLQALIEDIAGENFADYVSKNVLRPVGASRATFAITPNASFAHGAFENGQAVDGGFRRHPESAAAGLWATASDLAKVYKAILDSLNRTRNALLPPGLAEQMITPVTQQVGLGVFVSPGRMIWHEGRNYGFDSIVAAELTTGQVRVAITNRNGAIESYAHRLLSQ